jgi:hypothetical protein
VFRGGRRKRVDNVVVVDTVVDKHPDTVCRLKQDPVKGR